MSLGWGLRGSIGGGFLGAMIPGAMIALALCRLLGREAGAGTIAAFGAIGVGFGGQETYGQTVGLSYVPETFAWAILGFAIKGAAWGLAGGACLGTAFERDRVPYRRLLLAFAAMILGCWAGWALINYPKLIYFSNRLDRPREELWAGLWLGGLLYLAVLRNRTAQWFALAGTIGGGVGFAVGAALQVWGRGVWAEMPLGWWKVMELTFGALFGLALGLCAWRLRDGIAAGQERPARTHLLQALAFAVLAVSLTALAGEALPIRFPYTVACAVLACLAWRSEPLAWQTAITATYFAFSLDAVEHFKELPAALGWSFIVLSSAIVAAVTARFPRAGAMFLLLTWTGVANAFRYLGYPGRPAERLTMLAVFVVLAIAATSLERRYVSRAAEPRP
jgi:hypothetical protein